MGEEILHPDGQPAGAAQQGERGERSSRWPLRIYLLAFIGKTGRQLFSSPLYFVHKFSEMCERRGKGELTYSAYGWHGTHSYNPAGPDASCMEEVTANCVHPKLPLGVLQPAFKSATTSSYVIAAFNGS